MDLTTMTRPSTNGTHKAKAPAKPKTPKAKAAKRTKDHVRLGITLCLGTGIPLLSLGLSNVAGTLASQGQYVLAAFAGVLMAAVLVVSLPHIAYSIRNITGTDNRASWALAVSVDLALVLCELVHVAAVQELAIITTAIMVCVCGVSMVLNCWAFIMSAKAK